MVDFGSIVVDLIYKVISLQADARVVAKSLGLCQSKPKVLSLSFQGFIGLALLGWLPCTCLLLLPEKKQMRRLLRGSHTTHIKTQMAPINHAVMAQARFH